MRTTSIPRVDRPVSVVGFGCWALSGPDVWTSGSDAAGTAAVHRAIELGINFFDVAPVYGLGRAEEVLGSALGDSRDDVVIATKCGLVWDEAGKVTNNLTGPSLREEIEASLRRLQTDYVDIYQIHWPDPATPIEESMEALLAIQDSGEVRHIGVSNFSVADTETALGCGRLATYQGLLNLLEPNAESYHGIPLDYRSFAEVLPFVAEHDMSFLPYSPIMQGLLSDSYDPGAVGPQDVRRENPNLFGPKADAYLHAAARLRRLARDMGRPLEQVAVNWLAAQPGMGPVIAGAETVAQVEATAAAGSWELTSEEITAVTEAAVASFRR
ncbi:MAG: aldo/keto reductase [Acidimicrobiia bacterium]|nr:aldo/keto reductase [Acidimicrobiia bacterium]